MKKFFLGVNSLWHRVNYTHFVLKCNMFLPIPSLAAMESVLIELQIKP